MMARLKNMTILHQGQEIKRYVYFGANTAFVIIGKHEYEAERVSPGIWKTARVLTGIESAILIEQAESETWTPFQKQFAC